MGSNIDWVGLNKTYYYDLGYKIVPNFYITLVLEPIYEQFATSFHFQ